MERIRKQEYFMQLARLTASRSACLRRQVGAVVIRDEQIVATGYNGPARGVQHCIQAPPDKEFTTEEIIQAHICPRILKNVPSGQVSHCWAIHAEENCIAQAARHGVSLKDGTMFCTTQPCYKCLQMCINVGIKYIFYDQPYEDPYVKTLMPRHDIKMWQYNTVPPWPQN